MASSSSAGRAQISGSKSFDFGSDDILCSYEDFGNQDGNNGGHSDPSISSNSNKELNKSRMGRSHVYPPATYSTPEESSFSQGVVSAVDNTMKKYSENVMRFLEGISSRLSQLELYCYNLDKSIGEMHSDLVRDHGESETKLKSLEKHIQEVHRSVQILRDKQELADTQKELAKLQLAQKESSNKQPNEERASRPAAEPKHGENSSDFHDQHLALALPNHVSPHHARPNEHQHPSVAPQSSMPPQTISQVQTYYLPHQQMAPQPQGNVNPQVQLLPPYQQQWSNQPVQPTQIRTSSPMVYSPYLPGQNQSPTAEMPHGSMHMYGGASRPGSAGSDGISYGYGAPGRAAIQQQAPPPQLKTEGGYRPQLPPNAYMVFDGESGRAHHLPQGGYPSHPPRVPSTNALAMRAHPYGELVEKLVNMGYRGDHVLGVIQRLEENSQPVDFNAVLDRLNGHSPAAHRGW